MSFAPYKIDSYFDKKKMMKRILSHKALFVLIFAIGIAFALVELAAAVIAVGKAPGLLDAAVTRLAK